jgi:RNA polymerase sigma-70 factor (ECF subfamily)
MALHFNLKLQGLRIEPVYKANVCAQAFQRGEEKGFDFFFRELFPSLCFFANHILNNRCEAEDIASAAFIKIWKRHSQFNDAKNIRSYLYQIVRNDCLKFLQKKERSVKVQKEIKYLTIVDTNDNCESDIIRAEFFRGLYKALNSLPTECRKVYKLYIEGKKVSEIAEELKISPSTVKAQKARGLALLKKKFINTTLIFFLILFSLFVFCI